METVIIRKCESYDDLEKLETILKDGMQELDFKPKGNTMIKINEVAAFPKQKIFKYASTPPEFLDATLNVIESKEIEKDDMKRLYLGGNCGITIPTRFSLKCGGQWKILKKHKIKTYCFDERKEVNVKLKKGVVHKELRIPKILQNTDTIISLPRFKANPFTTITASIKMNVGMLDDKERMKHHNYNLDEKIVDILEVAVPSFIAVDAIVAGEKNMLEPKPYPIGAVIMGTNPVAVDSLICNMIGINPMDVKHIKIAYERGYGPVNLNEITLSGDMQLGELKERAKDFKTDTDKIDKFKSRIKFYVGPSEKKGYCFGGCPGALKEAFNIIKALQPGLPEEIKPMHVVFGDYKGDIATKENEPILLLGSCTKLEGKINDKNVLLNTNMKQHQIKKLSNYKRIMKVNKCPLSVAENILLLSYFGKTKNPYLDKDVVMPFGYNFVVSKLSRFFHRHIYER